MKRLFCIVIIFSICGFLFTGCDDSVSKEAASKAGKTLKKFQEQQKK